MLYIEPPFEETKFHFKPLTLQKRANGSQTIGWWWNYTVNIFSKTMLKRFGLGKKNLVKNNIMVTDFCGRSSSSMGMITLNVIVGSYMRATMFMVIHSQAIFNVCFRRE